MHGNLHGWHSYLESATPTFFRQELASFVSDPHLTNLEKATTDYYRDICNTLSQGFQDNDQTYLVHSHGQFSLSRKILKFSEQLLLEIRYLQKKLTIYLYKKLKIGQL